MKLTYRDKIIAAVLIFIVVLLVGIFAPIKTTSKQIKADKATLAEKEAIKKDYEDKIAEIPKLKESIKTTYSKTTDITKMFVPVDEVLDSQTVDKYMQKFADDNHVMIQSLQVNAAGTGSLDYYYTAASDQYAEVRNAADVNGTLQEEFNEANMESTVLSQRAKETVMRTQYGMTVTGTRKNIWNYLKAIKDYDKAILINSVNIADYSFGEDAAEAANVSLPDSPEGEVVEVQVGEQKISNTSTVNLVITLFSVYEMEEPNVES